MNASRLTAWGLALSAAVLAVTPGSAQDGDTLSAPEDETDLGRLGVELRIGSIVAGNFFQAPDELPKEDVLAGTGETRLLFPLGGSRSSGYAAFGGTLFDEFDPSLSFTAGARLHGGIQLLDGRVSYRTRSPRIEVGDSLGFADVLIVEGSYRLRPVRAFHVEGLVGFDRQTYGISSARDNRALELGGAIRYYGFGYEFSPEIGATFGGRDVETDQEDYDQRTLWLTLRSSLGSSLFLSVRYRHRLRDYTTADALASNFAREDVRQDVTVTVDVALSERWSVTGYFSFDDADSTKASRTFQTHYLWTGLTYRLY